MVDQIKAKTGSAIKVKPCNVLSEMAKVVTIDAGRGNWGVQTGQIFMVYAEGSSVLGLKEEILDVEKMPLRLIQIDNRGEPQLLQGESHQGRGRLPGGEVHPLLGGR